MGQPDAGPIVAAGAPVLFRRGPGRKPTAPTDSAVLGRVGGILSITDHRVSAHVSGATTVALNLHLRTLWPGKHEPCGADRSFQLCLVLSDCWALGGLLR